jgi:hypothetical protein
MLRGKGNICIIERKQAASEIDGSCRVRQLAGSRSVVGTAAGILTIAMVLHGDS